MWFTMRRDCCLWRVSIRVGPQGIRSGLMLPVKVINGLDDVVSARVAVTGGTHPTNRSRIRVSAMPVFKYIYLHKPGNHDAVTGCSA